MSDMQAPADPQSSLAYRGAKYAVIILSALIILALIGLVIGVVMKLSGRSTHFAEGGHTFILPQGARVLATEAQPGRLILHVRSPEGDEIDIISTEDGKLVGRVVSARPTPPARQ